MEAFLDAVSQESWRFCEEASEEFDQDVNGLVGVLALPLLVFHLLCFLFGFHLNPFSPIHVTYKIG